VTIDYFDPIVTRIMRLGRVVSLLGPILSALSMLAIFSSLLLWAVLFVSGVSCIFFTIAVFLWVRSLREKAKESHPWMR